MDDKYILGADGRTPEPTDTATWARWFKSGNRRVALDDMPGGKVSTVFLGLDHSFGEGPPELFETMIFWDRDDEYCVRSATWDAAEAAHAEAVAVVVAEVPPAA